MELKSTRLKIKALDENCTRHGVIALDQYFIEGVTKINIDMEGRGRPAVVRLEILLRDIDTEIIPREPEESPSYLKKLKELEETKWKAENESTDSEKVVRIEDLENLIARWERRLKAQTSAPIHEVIRFSTCIYELNSLIKTSKDQP